MIKLLVLCLLATVVTMEDTHADNHSESTTEDTHSTHHSIPHPSTTAVANGSSEVTHSVPHPSEATVANGSSEVTHSAVHPSEATDAKGSSEVTHSALHPSAATDREATSGHPTATLTCSCTTGADCHEQHCTTKASKHFCVTTAENNTLDGTQRLSVSHTCGDNVERCNETIAITLSDQVYWRSLTRCCHHDNCNSLSLEVPPADTARSKLVCPSCFAVNNAACTEFHHMKCAASETQCISVSGTVENGDHNNSFTGQGCASPSAIHFNGITLVFGNATYRFSHIATMSDASPTSRNVPFAFLLSSFVVLLQADSIY